MTRFRIAIAGVALAAAALGGVAHADDRPAETDSTRSTWACVALSHVDVGSCLRNPFDGVPRPVDAVGDHTGVRPDIDAPRLPEG